MPAALDRIDRIFQNFVWVVPCGADRINVIFSGFDRIFGMSVKI